MINSLCLRDKKVGGWWTKKNIVWLRSLASSQNDIKISQEGAWLLESMLDEIEFYDRHIAPLRGSFTFCPA